MVAQFNAHVNAWASSFSLGQLGMIAILITIVLGFILILLVLCRCRRSEGGCEYFKVRNWGRVLAMSLGVVLMPCYYIIGDLARSLDDAKISFEGGFCDTSILRAVCVALGVEAIVTVIVEALSIRTAGPWAANYLETLNAERRYPLRFQFGWKILALTLGTVARAGLIDFHVFCTRSGVSAGPLNFIAAVIVLGFVLIGTTTVQCMRETWWGREDYVAYACPVCQQDLKGCSKCHNGKMYLHP